MWPDIPARTELAPTPAERRAAIAALLDWAKGVGATWDGIAFLVDDAGHAAVRATRPLAEGEPILTLPRHAMIIDNELGALPIGQLAIGDDPRDTLSVWLPLELRDPASPWRAYLDALPVQLTELPMFRDTRDREQLAGTSAHASGAGHAREVISSYARLSAAVRAQLSLAEYAWGCAIVLSRAFQAPGTFEHRIAMLPVVDLLDHKLGDTTWTYDPRDTLFTVITARTFAAGESVHLTYGHRSNSYLLVHFGFTEPGNPASEAALGFDDRERVVVGLRFDSRMRRAISIARLHAADVAERDRLFEGLTDTGQVPWLGAAHEIRAFTVLVAVAERALAALAAVEPSPAAGSWARACRLVRDGERGVLEQVLAFARTVLATRPWTDGVTADADFDATDLVANYRSFFADDFAVTR